MRWLKSKTQLTIITNEAPVRNEIKAPNRKIMAKIKKDHVGLAEKKLFQTSQI